MLVCLSIHIILTPKKRKKKENEKKEREREREVGKLWKGYTRAHYVRSTLPRTFHNLYARRSKVSAALVIDVDTNKASNNPSIGPLYPDIATADLKDEGVKADIISKSDPSLALSFQFPSR